MKKNSKDTETIVGSLVRVKLTISGNGHGQLKAGELARESAQAHGADEDSISGSVKWLPKEYRKLIGGASGALRAGFNTRTLPWEDGGYRVIPSDRYNELCGFVAQFSGAYTDAVEMVVKNWDAVVADAKKRLNGTLKMVTLPTAEEFRQGFGLNMDSSCVVAPSAIRITGLDESAIIRIRKQAETQYTDKIEAGVGQLCRELCDLLNDLVERTNKDEQKGIRYDGWASWAKKTVGFMRPLNITGNQTLTNLLNRVEKIATTLDGHSLRNVASLRSELRKEVKEVTKTIDALDNFGA